MQSNGVGAATGAAGKRPRRSRAEWVDEVTRFRASGQRAAEYAIGRGLHPRTLIWWATQLERGGAAKRASRDNVVTSVPRSRAFLEVRPSASAEKPTSRESSAATVEVILRNGRRVRVGADFEAMALVRLLQVLEERVAC